MTAAVQYARLSTESTDDDRRFFFMRIVVPILRIQEDGHPIYKIYKQSCRLNVSLYSFPNRIVDVWNMLPFELVCTPTAVQFKIKLELIDFNAYILDKY